MKQKKKGRDIVQNMVDGFLVNFNGFSGFCVVLHKEWPEVNLKVFISLYFDVFMTFLRITIPKWINLTFSTYEQKDNLCLSMEYTQN